MKRLRKNLKNNMTVLRVAYKKYLNSGERSEAAKWLCDNFHVVRQSCSDALALSKKSVSADKSDAFAKQCDSICRGGVLPDDDKIISLLLKDGASTGSLECLFFYIVNSLLFYAAEGVKTKNDSLLINAVRSLLRLRDADFGRILYEVSETEKILCQDPAGIYRSMNDETKDKYREAVCRKSEKEGRSEASVAVEALERAKEENKHIGFFLDFGKSRKPYGIFVIVLDAVLPLAAGILLSVLLKAWYVLPLCWLPLWECLKFVGDTASSFLPKDGFLPKMEFERGVPEEEKTVIAVSVLLPSAGKARELSSHLADLCRSNCKGSAAVCVLADLKSAPTPTTPSDKADIKAMKRVINRLNNTYPGKFVLAVRPRTYCETQNEYTGKERKRGAITSLVKYINGSADEFLTVHGDEKALEGAKYIMALDSDTEMPMGSLISLVETAAHPLNRPVVSVARQRVVSGYGIIAPRVETSIESAGRTHFSSVMAGSGGLPAYSAAAGERYRDFFSESIFSGKGLINVDCFARLLVDRFPEQRVLSHDVLEGTVLRTAFAGDTALTDSFPSNENSYFKRLHRWIRGDMQNLPFVFKKNRTVPSGKIPPLGKWWLIDNVRRAVTPTVAVLGIILSLFMNEATCAVVTAAALLSAAAPDLFSCFITLVRGGASMASRLYFSGAAPYALVCFMRALARTVMLAAEAQTALDAVLRASFRMIFSKKHLLEWTTAADSESGNGSASLIKRSAPSLVLGVVLLCFSSPFLRFAGVVFILNVPFAVFSALEKRGKRPVLSESEKNTLISYCASMWKFYENFCTMDDNYLVPDNVQHSPVNRTARRTSPTNIGLMLCAFLAARDFEFISTNEMCTFLENSLDSIEKLEKYEGNLYNWYDTATLSVLMPRFVSTVDSGNFLCCLAALKEGLKRYESESGSIADIRKRCEKLIDACNLGFLYDRRKNLFHIGFDSETGSFTQSYFDLLMSEARMTSYFAVASGISPVKHWQTLGRTVVKSGRYTGPVSWSGTMFEYFMPSIFLPAAENTLVGEGLKFCIHCQKKRVAGTNIPYGISESGYFAFDRELNYQYKAHGVSALSLGNSPFDETVISPYSSFLTLSEDPHFAMANLKRLERLGMYGKFGFYEAADFTESRNSNQDFSVVRSYMAHHVGMSFLSAANAVFDNIMSKRFMSDDAMSSGKSLLYEKIPSDAKVYKNIYRREIPQRPERMAKVKDEYSTISLITPNSHAVTNGEWSFLSSDSGMNASVYSNKAVFKVRGTPFSYPDGVFAAIKDENETILPFTLSPKYFSSGDFSAVFTETSAVYKNRNDDFFVCETVCVHPRYAAQMHTFTLRNKTKSTKKVKLMIYCEPELRDINERNTHPAFSNLFITCGSLKSENAVWFTRNNMNKSERIYVVCGFLSKARFACCFDREAVLPRETGIFGLFDASFNIESESADKCVAAELTVTLKPRSTKSETLVFCAGNEKSEAVNRLAVIRREGQPQVHSCAASCFDAASITGIYAKKLIERVFFGRALPDSVKAALARNNGSREDLWRLGISGDFPIIAVNAPKDDDICVEQFAKLHSKLRLLGIITELVFLSDEDGEYKSYCRDRLRAVGEGDLIGKRGGIFVVNPLAAPKKSLGVLLASCCAVYPETDEKPSAIPPTDTVKCASKAANVKNMFINKGYLVGKTPYLPWCHVIAGRNFGTLLTDSSLGFTWCMNSRENKLTAWKNDTRSELDGERLILFIGNEKYDIIKGSTPFFSQGSAVYISVVKSFEIKCEVTVENEKLCKTMDITIKNKSNENISFSLYYYVKPVLGDSTANGKYIKLFAQDGKAYAFTPYNTTFGGYMCVSSDGACDYSFSENGFLPHLAGEDGLGRCIVARRRVYLPGQRDKNIKFYLSYAKNRNAAAQMANIAPKKTATRKIEIETPDRELNRIFNDFLPSQIIEGRIFARTGFYQCSGAYGFRDQLQDAMAVVLTHPEILRQQIFRCAAAQFSEGDVLHWFHPLYYSGRKVLRGVRTRCSDDMVWLALAVSEYCLKTGDMSVLSVSVPFLSAPVLEDGENERFGEYTLGNERASLFNHCVRAIKYACSLGEHSLPLIKCGDWNDSFNLVGENGRGESVWLAMFLSYTAKKFAAVCEIMKKTELSHDFTRIARGLLQNVDKYAWDNDRYLRCFYDDSSPMGKEGNRECAVDLLPQSWSVISGMENKSRCAAAVNTAYTWLVDKESGVIKLFSPPFTVSGKRTGYVNMYPAGIRENGGQYTHGAVWLAEAFFRLGDGEKGYELINILNPAKKNTAVYKTEPYYLAGDVYGGEKIKGRGGWSIYTGAAGWFYRTVYESMLGVKQIGGRIKINPCLPEGFGKSRVKIITEKGTREFILRANDEKRDNPQES